MSEDRKKKLERRSKAREEKGLKLLADLRKTRNSFAIASGRGKGSQEKMQKGGPGGQLKRRREGVDLGDFF